MLNQSQAIIYCLNETDSGILWQNKTENTKKHEGNRNRTAADSRGLRRNKEHFNRTSNEIATKKLLQQRKFKKFTSLKYKPKSAVKTVIDNNEGSRTTEEQPRPRKPSYAQALKSNTNTFEKVNSTNHHENKTK